MLLKNWNRFKTSRILAKLPFVRYALQSKVPMSATTSKMLQYLECNPMFMPKIMLLTRAILESFQKEKGRFFMPPFCHIFYALVMILYTLPCFLWHHLLQRQEFWVQQLIPHVLGAKNEIYYSLLLFIYHYSLLLFTVTIHLLLFTPKFCLFKGGCPLYLKQVFCMLSSGLLP